MLFYARKVLKELGNPLLIFITDRRELDEQLYSLFSQMPIAKRAESIKDLQDAIKNTAGGIIFSTIQKFSERDQDYPLLTERRDIIVIADEAHRSQYRELARNLRKAIPNASFLGFTATPIQYEDRDTYLVFGEPISIYSIDKAIKDGVIVPIYYEARLVELHLTNEFIDEEFEEISEGLEEEEKERLKAKYARLEKLILNPERLEKIAKDIVEHFNKRLEEFEGKAMVVVISREVAVELYNKIKEIPNAPSVAVVISGNKQKDPEKFHPHLRNKHQMEELLSNFKNPDKDPKMVIVVDMLLTGFDVPCLHTMYIDKPMKNHTLLQAIARVNRVYKDKPGGLIVDYIGIADDLKKSLAKYTLETIGQFFTDIKSVIAQLKEEYDIVSSMFYGINYKNWRNLDPQQLSNLTVSAYNLLDTEEKKKNFIKHFLALKKLYTLASPHPETIKIKDDIRFFEMIKKMIIKYSTTTSREIARDLEYEINQLISKSISAQEPIDVFSLLNKEKPDISILSEDFLSQIKEIKQKNYAVELLAKLLNDEIKVKMRKNPHRYKSLYERLKELIEKYNAKTLEASEIIEKLVEIARELREKIQEGKRLDLTEEELAFYDMLLSKRIFENYEEVKEIAKLIVEKLGGYVKIADWNKKETIKAKIRKALKDVLRERLKKYDYDYISEIVNELLEQAELDVFSSPTTAFPQMDFIFGARANRFFSWYVFYQVLYSQREMKVYEWDTFRIPGRIKDLPLYHYAGLGFDITTVFRGLNQKTPYGFRIEIGGSYFRHNGRYEPVISFGFALTNASALWLIDMTFNYVCLPMLAIALSSMLDNNQSKSTSAQQPTSGEQKPPKDTTGKGRRVEKGKENKEVIIRIDEMEKKGEELKEDSTKVENKQPAVQDTVKKDTVKKDTTVKVPKKPKVIRKGITKKPQPLPKKDTGKGIREEKPSETR
jgi:type I restriction enzyme R subunit